MSESKSGDDNAAQATGELESLWFDHSWQYKETFSNLVEDFSLVLYRLINTNWHWQFLNVHYIIFVSYYLNIISE